MDLSDVKAAIIKAAPGFGDVWVRSFDWRQHGDIVTAKPRYPISEMCFQTVKKVFKRFGGKHVAYQGRAYFELVLKPEAEQNGSRRAHTYSRMCVLSSANSPHTPEPVFSRLENQLARLKTAGSLTKEV